MTKTSMYSDNGSDLREKPIKRKFILIEFPPEEVPKVLFRIPRGEHITSREMKFALRSARVRFGSYTRHLSQVRALDREKKEEVKSDG